DARLHQRQRQRRPRTSRSGQRSWPDLQSFRRKTLATDGRTQSDTRGMTKCSNSSEWEQLSFNEAVEPVSDGGKRVDQREYRPSGALPVIDQGESFIGGYTDDLSKSYTGPLPVVVFGDHTRRVKLVNERFAVGAQGVKLL